LFVPIADFVGVPKVAERKGYSSTRYQKFLENAWYSVYYPLSAFTALSVIYGNPWFWDFRVAIDYSIVHVEPNRLLDYVYLLQIGYYIQLLINLVFVDEKLDDFYEMLIHHNATLILVGFSYVALFHRIGSLIFFLHDLSDICLYIGKMAHNAAWEKTASIVFPLFILSFFVTRIVYFPQLIYGCLISEVGGQAFYHFDSAATFLQVTQTGICVGGHCISSFLSLTYLLCVLLCLHFYWFYRIILLVISTIQNSGIVPGDPRYKAKNQ
jgi:hypothetical protein